MTMKTNKKSIMTGIKSLSKDIKIIKGLFRNCENIYNRKKLQYSADFMKRLSIQIFSKYEKFGRAT